MVRTQRSAKALACGAPGAMVVTSAPMAADTWSKARLYWAVQVPVGLVVIPARRMSRVPTSIKNRTWNRRRATVSTQKKSVATRGWAWLAMNSLQDGPVRFGVGSRPALRRVFHIVEAATRCPRRHSSPWIRR